MPISNYSVEVKKSVDEVWNILTDTIYHPDKYIVNVYSNSIIEDNENYVIRKISTEFTYKERIEIDYNNKTLKFVLLNHPIFRGFTYYKINESDGDKVNLQVILDWQIKSEKMNNLTDELFHKFIRNSAKNIKELAEF